jgi:hypothetical protein
MSDKSRSQQAAADIAALLRARNPIIWVVSREEARVEKYLRDAADAAKYAIRFWDVGNGVYDRNGETDSNISAQLPDDVLDAIKDRAERCVWVLRDFPVWLQAAVTLRKLRNLARTLPATDRDTARAVIVLSPTSTVPPELQGHATVVEWPLPDRTEIGAILDAAIAPYEGKIEPLNGQRDAAIDAAVGLDGREATACYARSLVQNKRIDVVTVSKEKKRVIAGKQGLEWYDPLPGGLDSVGGLDNLKSWLLARKSAYSAKARAYGLPAPKGALLVGIPGTGKSLTAKAVATAWGVPLLRLDLGALKSKFVGDSEGNLREAFKVIESVGRCVVWLDEIEKSLQGATSGSADGGVSADALGAVLSWMQERSGEAFVVATANDAEALPPELLRKGRFDEVWWVDLPTPTERIEILSATLKNFGRKVEASQVAIRGCQDFTGSEIAAIVPEALFAAFGDGEREVTAADLEAAAATVVPLAKTASEKISRLRAWAKGRARPASKPAGETARSGAAQLDI